jgi:hypothetical protein
MCRCHGGENFNFSCGAEEERSNPSLTCCGGSGNLSIRVKCEEQRSPGRCHTFSAIDFSVAEAFLSAAANPAWKPDFRRNS